MLKMLAPHYLDPVASSAREVVPIFPVLLLATNIWTSSYPIAYLQSYQKFYADTFFHEYPIIFSFGPVENGDRPSAM